MLSFPLKRENNINFQNIYNIFYTMSDSHRTSFTTNNITNKKLEDFYGLIIVQNKTIKRLEQVSDYFQEHNKISAKRYDEELSPYEYWYNNKTATREEINQKIKECTTFCPTIICTFIKLFKSKHILDFSSGWGDRLFGVMTMDDKIKSYYGIDPNKSLHTGYNNMIKSFLPKKSHIKYNMICECAEDYIDKINNTFDLVFTSPPYYNLEIYCNDKSQSIEKYTNYDIWYTNFLLECMYKSINKLIKTGILAININTVREYHIVNRLIGDMSKITDLKFKGIIYYGDPQCKTYIYQPILVWEKV